MTAINYDGSFEGLLTAIFEVFEYKFTNVVFSRDENYNSSMFGNHNTITDEAKASRVWKGLSQKISVRALTQLYKSFLSEEKEMETMLLQYMQHAFKNNNSIENTYADRSVLWVVQTAKKVDREKHRMKAFIRFQLTKDNLYYAICQPDFNVLPLIESHFKNRYADQRWLIYDCRRKYGMYYDLDKVETVQISFNEENNFGKNITSIFDEKEELYQTLWQQYFQSVNIAARKNMKLHIQHMPKRYWKYLPEKQEMRK